MANIENLREQLYNKALQEQSEYIENLKQQPPDMIIEAAYEKVIRDDILIILETDEYMSERQIKELLKLPYPLSACYNEWLDNDCSYMDMLRDTVDDFSKDLVKKAEQEKAEKKKHEPER